MIHRAWVGSVLLSSLLFVAACGGSGGGGSPVPGSSNDNTPQLPLDPPPEEPPPPEPPSQAPNVILLYIDDLNNDLGCYGNPVVQSPRMDSLAARGMRFDRAYCPYPLCDASRMSMLSGLRPTSAGLLKNREYFPPGPEIQGVPLLPVQFRRHGYQTGGVGKIFSNTLEHLAHPENWDEYHDFEDDPGIPQPDPNPIPGERVLVWGEFKNGADGSLGKMSDTHNTDAFLGMMERFEEPFFLTLGIRKPHSPYVYPERFGSLYNPSTDVPPLPPEEAGDDWRRGVPLGNLGNQAGLPPEWDNDPDGGRREFTVAYWRLVSYVDEQVGRVLDRVDELGMADRTILVLVSDHGFSLGHHGHYAKNALWDRETRAPLLISVPWLTPGQSTEVPVDQIDLYPTLMELCGLSVPAGLEGESLVPLLRGESRPSPGVAFSMLQTNGVSRVHFMSRSEDGYKFVRWDESDDHMLYDLNSDPGEYRNLYGDPAYQPIVDKHLQYMAEEGLLRAYSHFARAGVPGSLGVPRVTASDRPILGTTIELDLVSSSPSPEAGVLVMGQGGGTTATPFGGNFLTSQILSLTDVTLDAAEKRVSFDIPDDSGLAGFSHLVQLAQTDSGAANGYSLSRVLRLWFWSE